MQASIRQIIAAADDYEDTLRSLVRRQRLGVCPGLERVQAALDRWGNPHLSYATIHVAGTNGKGSTVAMIAAMLSAAGLRVGRYTSPHLSRFTERITIAGQEIAPRDVARTAREVLDPLPELTFFEAATVLAFVHFREQSVDVAVVETGLGGRLDATNVVVPDISVITPIALDHMELLGSDIGAIAGEKAGIIKRAVPTIVGAQSVAAAAVLRQAAHAEGSPLLQLGHDFTLVPAGDGLLTYHGVSTTIPAVALALEGLHQLDNAATALAAVEGFLNGRHQKVDPEALRRGLAETRWPGRMERIGQILLDGAHNQHGFAALNRALPASLPICLVTGLLGPKDPRQVLAPILPRCARLIVTRPRSPRALSPSEVCNLLARGETVATLAEAFHCARADAPPLPIVVAGSLYLVAEARAMLLSESCDPVDTWDPIAVRSTAGD